jgi:hypothetical protein
VKHDFKDWLLACIVKHLISHRGMANMSGAPVFHLRGRNPCGAVAFYYSGAIRDGKIIEGRHATALMAENLKLVKLCGVAAAAKRFPSLIYWYR